MYDGRPVYKKQKTKASKDQTELTGINEKRSPKYIARSLQRM